MALKRVASRVIQAHLFGELPDTRTLTRVKPRWTSSPTALLHMPAVRRTSAIAKQSAFHIRHRVPIGVSRAAFPQ